MKTITLSKALQVKNRLAEQITIAQKLVVDNNSRLVITGSESEVDVAESYKTYVELQGRMVDLKDRISEANRPIQAAIFELSELKGRVSMLKGLNTRHGKEAVTSSRYFDEDSEVRTIEYVAIMRKQDVAEEIRRLQLEIDSRQEMLDNHNHKVTIEFDLDWM